MADVIGSANPGESAAAGGAEATKPKESAEKKQVAFKAGNGKEVAFGASKTRSLPAKTPTAAGDEDVEMKGNEDTGEEEKKETSAEKKQPDTRKPLTKQELINQFKEQHAALKQRMTESGASAEVIKQALDSLKEQMSTAVAADVERETLRREVELLKAERQQREAAALAEKAAIAQKALEEENREKEMEMEMAMDYRATKDPFSSKEEEDEYRASLMGMSLKAMRAVLAPQRKELEKLKSDQLRKTTMGDADDVDGYFEGLSRQYKRNEDARINPVSANQKQLKALPTGIEDHMDAQTNKRAQPDVQASSGGKGYSGQSAYNDEFDPYAWARMAEPPPIERFDLTFGNPKSRKMADVYASVAPYARTDAFVQQDYASKADAPMFVNGERVNTRSVCASIQMRNAYTSSKPRKGEGANFSFSHIGRQGRTSQEVADIRIATVLALGGPSHSFTNRSDISASEQLKEMYDFPDNVMKHMRGQPMRMEEGHDYAGVLAR